MKKTLVMKIPLVDPSAPLEQRITDICDVEHAAGYRLSAGVVINADLVLIFQLP
jgi:hypothetical protein